MQTTQGNSIETLRNVRTFLDQHADALGAVLGSGTRADLLAVIADLEGYVTQQAAGAGTVKNATITTRVLRRTLVRRHMRLVARIARSRLADSPELANLRMPRGGELSAAKLAAAAYEMASSAQQHAPVFVAAGLPTDFAVRLTSAADALIQSRQARTMSRVDQVAATRALRTNLSAGRKIVRVLDAMVEEALDRDPELLVAWQQVKRVSKVSGLSTHVRSSATPASETAQLATAA